jgi:diaminohydroxyphosphoribosylaminopyrimidine deaminase/5-amino-6-(5-phosphoribosylamino)uracil reductase
MSNNKLAARTLELARFGETLASPNPIVGAAIILDGNIVAEGFHRKYGEAHAEVNAVNQALSKNIDLSKCDIYVSLEPCAHHGKTPPCSELIIKHRFKSLAYVSRDPNEKVSGKGIEAIEKAGIKIHHPDSFDIKLQQEALEMNRAFFKIIQGKKQFITLKKAVDHDGKMFIEPGVWKTGEAARKQVHRIRSTHQLIVTSIRTVIADNPQYDVRFSPEELGLADIRNPDILILKSKTDFTDQQRKALKIFDPKYNRKIIEHQIKDISDPVELKIFIESLDYQKILVETGPRLSESFENAAMVDDLIIHSASS